MERKGNTMPGGMPGNIEKGFILRRLGEVMSIPGNKQALDDAKRDLLATQPAPNQQQYENPLSELGQTYLGSSHVRDIDKVHLERHWFNPRSGACWWIDQQPIDPIVRNGIVQAIDLRLANMDLPVDCYWICAGESMEVISCVSGNQITLLILTPSVPVPPRLDEPVDNQNYRYGNAEDIYVTRPPATGPGEANQVGGTITDDHVNVRPRRLEQKP